MNALRVLASPKIWISLFGVVAVLALIFFAYLAAVASPQENLKDLPVALVNEDRGGELAGEQVTLGDQVADRVTSPESPAAGVVEWLRPATRKEALAGLGRNEYYGAIVIPKDYSERLASLSGPPPGAPSEIPQQGAGPPEPKPANVELLTSPAVRPAVTAQIEDAFNRIVGGVSGATRERILGGLSEMGVTVPPQAAAVISDPVRGEISEADVSDEAGLLPKAPGPAEIEILTNPSAGQIVSAPVQNISTGIVQGVSRATSERLVEAAGERGVQLTPEVAAVVGDPVRAKITEAQPVGPDSGNGQSPFFLGFLANLAGFAGAAAIFFGVTSAGESLVVRGQRPSRAGLWTVMLLLGALYAVLATGAELGVAFGLIGVEHEAGTRQVFLFLTLAVAAIMAVAMLSVLLLGPAGIGVAALLGVILGLVSSGGFAPIQALPGFYQAYADWLPLRYVVDGLRSLLFFDGQTAAGLGDAVRVLGAYLAGSVVLGYAASVARDFFGNRRADSNLDGGR